MKRRTLKLFWLGNILVPLLVGTLLYVLYRPDTIVSKAIYAGFPILYELAKHTRNLDFMRNYAGDILWAYAFVFCLSYVRGTSDASLLSTTLITIGCIILYELLQGIGLIPGTMDLWDIILESGSCIGGAICIKNYIRREL